jgi:glycosyltransferase involved in cell wall biosynthesis
MQKIRVLNLHWGFSVGGGASYTAEIDGVGSFAPIEMRTLCVLGANWPTDRQLLARLRLVTEIRLGSRCDLSWLWRVVAEIRRTAPHLIMTHGFNGHFVAMICRALSGQRPGLICSYHGEYYAPMSGRKLLAGLFNRFTRYHIQRQALSTVCVSEYSRNWLISKGVPHSKVVVVHNGIDANVTSSDKKRDLIRQEWGIGREEILLGIACRLDPIKGIPYLLDALLKRVSGHRRYKLVIVGGGPMEKELKEWVEANGLSGQVHFTGFRSDVIDCLAAFDIFVLPSLAENHSVALLEAMRAEKAIIATNVGGNTESISHEREGLIVPAADAGALGHAIERLATDAELRLKLGKSARKRFLLEFTREQMVRKTADWMVQCSRYL